MAEYLPTGRGGATRWNAALALVRRAILVTNDAPFGQVEDLKTENWVR